MLSWACSGSNCLKVLSSHLEGGSRVYSFDPCCSSRETVSLKTYRASSLTTGIEWVLSTPLPNSWTIPLSIEHVWRSENCFSNRGCWSNCPPRWNSWRIHLRLCMWGWGERGRSPLWPISTGWVITVFEYEDDIGFLLLWCILLFNHRAPIVSPLPLRVAKTGTVEIIWTTKLTPSSPLG